MVRLGSSKILNGYDSLAHAQLVKVVAAAVESGLEDSSELLELILPGFHLMLARLKNSFVVVIDRRLNKDQPAFNSI